jgi:ATP-dependent exoDNAse (exonuclease V) beta subunit
VSALIEEEAGVLTGPGGRPFTAEQATAVERRDGPLLLSANAGSGKTSVLVERFVRSVVDDALRPAQVLAITFTDKAAGELRSRVRARLLELGEREAARDTEAAWIMTFHGFCARVLRAHAVAAGLDPAFEVLDEASARALRREAFDAALAGFLADREDGTPRLDALDLVAAYGPDRLAEMVGDAHDTLRSRGRTSPALPEAPAADVAGARAEMERAARGAAGELAGARSLVTIDRARAALDACLETLGAIEPGEPAGADALEAACFKPGSVAELRSDACAAYLRAHAAYCAACADARARPALALVDDLLRRYASAYASGKRDRSGVDFDDLELLTRDLLERAPATAAGYAERFERIMVDEFQDTNPLQLGILRFLDRDNVFTVGDELQSIYGFRHADVRVFRARRQELEADGATATLATSFRAHPQIVETIDAAFAAEHGPAWVPLRAGRGEGADGDARVELLITDAGAWNGDPSPDLADGLPPAAAARHAEARMVAQRISALVAEGTSLGDVVVLLRAATDMGLFERALELEGLATLAAGGRGWWARRQVQDLCCHLGALVNPRDEAALLGLLASPLVGVSSDALALLAMAARRARTSLWDALHDPATTVPARDRDRLAAFRGWFGAERARAPRLGIDELLARVVQRTGYDLHVLALPGGARRLANVHKLMRLAAAYEARRGRDLRGFIDLATAELEADAREPDAPVDLGDLDAVRLMTIHAAKGLEFPVVVVADLGRQGTTRQPDLLVDGDRVGIRLVGIDGSSEKALAYDEIADARRAAEDAEERRVFHVAVTRAEERLILSGAAKLGDWPKVRPGAPPLSWIGRALVPDVASLSSDEPEVTVEFERDGHTARVRVLVNAPATVGRVMRLGPGAPGEQLTLALGDATEVPAGDGALATDQHGSFAERDAAAAVAAAGDPAATASGAPTARPPTPATMSYSSLARYAACPYRFHLERGLGLPEQEPPPHLRDAAEAVSGLDPLVRGTLVHELLERLAPGAPPATAAVLDVAAAHEAELSAEDVADLLAMVEAFASSALAARLAAAREVHREHAFAFPLGADAPLVTGVVDVLAWEADGSAVIIDYKSDRVAGADLEALVDTSYGIQRSIYALACLRAGAPAVEVVHVFLERAAEPVSRRYAAADAAALEVDLRARAAGLLAGEYPVAAVPHRGLCATCPGRAGLCSHPPELTDRAIEDALAL